MAGTRGRLEVGSKSLVLDSDRVVGMLDIAP